jgi:hypothetical protein
MSYFGSRADSDFDFTITIENNTHITNGGDPTGYFIDVKNIGTAQDTISIKFKIINLTGGDEPDIKEWNVHLDKDSVTLNPGESEVVVLTVETGCGCQDGTTATIRVTAQSINEPSMSKYVDTYTTRGPNLGEQLVRISIEDVSVFVVLTAGQEITFGLRVDNYQSVPQSYFITNTGKPAGWPIEFSTEPFEVGQNSKSSIKVHTKIPTENEPGIYTFSFNVRSDRDPTLSNSTKVPIGLYPELAVEKLQLSKTTPNVSEPTTLQVSISNLGQAVARNFVLTLYNGTQLIPKYLINSTRVTELYGNDSTIVEFTWVPSYSGVQNLTLYVNPNSIIKEAFNRYGNNLLTKEITVQKPVIDDPSKNGDDNDQSGESNIYLVAVIIIIIVILIVIFIIKPRTSSLKASGRTAQKIPLSRGSGGRTTKRGKKARKEKLTAAENARLKARHGRKRKK